VELAAGSFAVVDPVAVVESVEVEDPEAAASSDDEVPGVVVGSDEVVVSDEVSFFTRA
jgi:hypothetical protein